MSETVQSIIGFLHGKVASAPLSSDELSSLVGELRARISQLSASVANADPSAVTVLYSGSMSNGTHTGAVAAALAEANPGRVLTINQTEVYALLDAENVAFHTALRDAIGVPGPAREEIYKALIDGSNGGRTPDSLWDDASRRFAENATGKVRVVAPNADASRVFSRTELPVLLLNSRITSIEGIPIDELKSLAGQGGDAVFQRIKSATLTNIAYSGLRGSNLGDGIVLAGADHFLDEVTDLQQYLLNHPEAHGRFDSYVSDLKTSNPARYAELKAASQAMTADVAHSLGRGSRVLNKLGFLGTALGLALAASSATDAELSGDSEGAKEIMALWAADAAGSGLGEVAGTAVAGIALAAVAAAGGAVAAPLAGAVLVGASLIGGIFGSEAATDLYQLIKDMDGNTRIDLIDKLSNLLFGADSTITTPLPSDLNGEKLTLDTTLSREDIINRAEMSLAWRYTVRQLLPFVIPDISYDAHNQNGELDLYDPATGEGQITERFLEDRAQMLAWKIRYDTGGRDADDGIHDGPKPYNSDWDTSQVEGNWDYVDFNTTISGDAVLTLAIDGTGRSIADHQIVFGSDDAESISGGGVEDHLYGMGGNDTLTGDAGEDYLEGGAGDDSLAGGAGRDVIDGGIGADTLVGGDADDLLMGGLGNDDLHGDAGNDTLIGGAGEDTLRGGEGVDDYIILAGQGVNHIIDSDGRGRLFYGPDMDHLELISGFFEQDGNNANTWRSVSDESWMLADGVNWVLTRSGSDDQIVLESDIEGGALGFGLKQEPATGLVDLALTIGRDQVIADDATVTTGANIDAQDGDDYIFGSIWTDYIDAGGGNDWILPGFAEVDDPVWSSARYVGVDRTNFVVGHDEVIAGAGNDFVSQVSPNAVIRGGSGDDIIRGDRQFYLSSDMWDVREIFAHVTWNRDRTLLAGPNGLIYTSVGPEIPQSFSGPMLTASGTISFTFDSPTTGYVYGEVTQTLDSDPTPSTYSVAYYNAVIPEAYWVSKGYDGATLFGDAGNDDIAGTPGNDTIFGGADDDYLFGNDGDDQLRGDQGQDVLVGGRGEDELSGGAGADHLFGELDNDRLYGEGGADRIEAQDGNDFADGGADDDWIAGGLGSDTIYGGSGSDQLWGGKGEAFPGATDDEADLIDGQEGNDQIVGEGGDDTLIGGAGDDSIWGDVGNDVVRGGTGADSLYGDQGDDRLEGDAGDDELRGGDGNDTLIGGAGLDVLLGEAGNDTYIIRLGDMVRRAVPGSEPVAETISDNQGLNSLVLEGVSSLDQLSTRIVGTDLSITFGDNQAIYYEGGNAGGLTNVWAGRNHSIHQFRNQTLDEVVSQSLAASGAILSGGRLNDSLFTVGDNNTLMGGRGDDSLTVLGSGNTLTFEEGDGNDMLIAGVTAGSGAPGNSVLFGDGITADMLQLVVESGALRVAIGEQDSIVLTAANLANVTDSPAISRFVFADATELTWSQLLARGVVVAGTSAADTLHGTNAVDTISGGAGNDLMDGGGASDTYRFGWGSGADSIVASSHGVSDVLSLEFGAEINPTDIAVTWNDDSLLLSFLDSSVELLDYIPRLDAGTLPTQVTFDDGTVWGEADLAAALAGGATADGKLRGTVGADSIVAGDGPNTVFGLAGADTIDGGAGADVLEGGDGADLLIGGDGNDHLDGGLGNDQLFGGVDDDQLFGGDGNDTLAGGSGADVLDAGLGDDSLAGDAGMDVLQGGSGQDTLAGGADNDSLYGGIGDDDLAGGSGDDLLDGGSGANRYRFAVGEGADRVVDAFDSLPTIDATGTPIEDLRFRRTGDDLTIEIVGSATDRLTLSAYFAGNVAATGLQVVYGTGQPVLLSAQDVQNLTLGGSSSSELLAAFSTDERIDAGGGDDTVLAGAGNDTLLGGAGNDRLEGESGDDRYEFAAGWGQDTVVDAAGVDTIYFDGVLPSELLLRRDSSFNQVGNDLHVTRLATGDSIVIEAQFSNAAGVPGVNAVEFFEFSDGTVWNFGAIRQQALRGTPTDDVIYAFAEADSIASGAGNDTVRGQAGDDVIDGGDGDDLLRGEDGQDTVLGGSGADFVDGGHGNDWLDGGSGDDVLDGGYSGDDMLVGGGGNDSMRGWDGADTLDGGDGNNTLIGGGGGDVYRFAPGNWNDYIEDDSFDGDVNAIEFASGILPANVTVSYADELLVVRAAGSNAGQSYAGRVYFYEQAMALRFSDGTAWNDIRYHVSWTSTNGGDRITGSWNDDVIDGLSGNDVIFGSLGNDLLVGGAGSDLLKGGAGNDTLDGSADGEADTLDGGDGDDAYRFGYGYGMDRIEELGGIDRIEMQPGVLPADVVVVLSADDRPALMLNGGADLLEIGFGEIEQVVFADGTVWTDLASRVVGHAPVAAAQILGQGTSTGTPWSFVVPVDAFSDADPGDVLSYSANLADGSDLPGWLSFDPATRTFSGTPQLSDAGWFDLTVTVTDSTGLNASSTFSLGITESNVAPEIGVPLIDQTAVGGMAFAYEIAQGTFTDPNQDDVLSFAASLADGGVLPSWLAFDASTGTFSGVPASADAGELVVRVTATDPDGLSVSDEFTLSVSAGVIEGTAGADSMVGSAGSDALSGLAGDDTIDGGGGSDIIEGGPGNDLLVGGSGDDIFRYAPGDGADILDASDGGVDRLEFSSGITAASLGFHQDGDDLLVVVGQDLTQQVRIVGHFLGGESAIDAISSGDGVTFAPADIFGLLTSLPGSGGGGSEPTPGLGGADALSGTAGDDVLLGGAANDTLAGGAGSDRLLGGEGDDRYTFTAGQDVVQEQGTGNDTVVFANGITFSQVASGLWKSGNDLSLRVNGSTTNQLTVRDFFLGGEHVVETFSFETGGQFTAAQVFGAFGLSMPGPAAPYDAEIDGTTADDVGLSGTAGNDRVRGFNGDDVLSGGLGADRLEGGNGGDQLNGGAGSDTLSGGRGDDVYVVNAAGGQDWIDNVGGGFDTLHFDGVSFSQIASGLMKSGNDLILRVSGTSDQVRVRDWFLGGDNPVDLITFASGGQLTSAQLFGAFGRSNPDPAGSPSYQYVPDERAFGTVLAGASGAQNVLGSSDADMLDGGAGDDVLSGNAGNDYLMGGGGSDTYRFALGGGHDTINNLSNSAAADHDVLAWDDVVREDLWLSRQGNDLVFDVLGAEDAIVVQDWFADTAQRLDVIQAGGSSLYANEVDNLVNAMAAFGAPSSGEIVLTASQRDQVNTLIAASWQP